MAKFCLRKEQADAFLAAINDGKLNVEDMVYMETAQRRELLGQFVGPHAKDVNTLFESKLLLQNQQKGLEKWIQTTAGLDEKSKKEIFEKVKQLKRAIDPDTDEGEKILADLLEEKLKVRVTTKEANHIAKLSKEMEDLWQEAASKSGSVSPKAIRNTLIQDPELRYFRKELEMAKYIGDHSPKLDATKLETALSIQRAVITSLDVSASLRQGGAYFGTKEWFTALTNIPKYAQSEKAIEELKLQMISHPRWETIKKYRKELGLTLLGETFNEKEEAFAAKQIKELWGLNHSERVYVGFLNEIRFNRFVNMIDGAEKARRKITEEPHALKELATMISVGTGRGVFSKEKAPIAGSLSTVLFSPRWALSRIQVVSKLLASQDPIARKEGARNLATMVGFSASLMGLATAAGYDVVTDIRSSDFGRIKVGPTAIDTTMGMGPYMVLLARTALTAREYTPYNKTDPIDPYKSSVTGKTSSLKDPEFGQQDLWDAWTNFVTNKTSPMLSLVKELASGKTFEGREIEIDWENPTSEKNLNMGKYLMTQLFAPLGIRNTFETYADSGGDGLLTAVTGGLEFVGIPSTSYGYVPRGKEWDKLEEKYGMKTHAEATRELNLRLIPALKEFEANPKYDGLSTEDRNKQIDRVIEREELAVLRKYSVGSALR